MKKLLCKTTIDMSFKMCPKISLIFLFALLSIIHGEVKQNGSSCADETNFGTGKYCILEYGGGFTDKKILAKHYPDAMFYGVAKIADYKLEKFYSNLLDYPSLTILPEKGAVAYAAVILYPSKSYEARVTEATMCENQNYRYEVKVAAEVTVEGKQPLNVSCNTFVSTENVKDSLGEKPFKSDLETLVHGYRSAGFPDDYVNDIAKWETKPDPPCDDD